MVDDVFRSYRNHNTVAQARSVASRAGIGDLLAELARLTGQGDPYRDGGRDDGSFQTGEDDISPERRQRGRDSVPQEHGKQKKPLSTRHSSRPAVKFNGFPGEASNHPAAITKLQYSDAGLQTSPKCESAVRQNDGFVGCIAGL